MAHTQRLDVVSTDTGKYWACRACGTNPVDMLPFVHGVGGSLEKQRRLSYTRRAIHLCDFPSRITAGDMVAGEARRGKQLVELLEACRHSAGAARVQSVESL